ncbi:MAG: spermidine/putrescine ABC transporter permease [Actinomycetota bacterium]|nr:MAG: spermidine/putrescine ABC transporter permease [Actinomycetota bacterium]
MRLGRGGGRRGGAAVSRWLPRAIFLGPGLLTWGLLFAAPVALILVSSFLTRGTFGGIEYRFTLDNFVRALDPLYVRVLWSSIRIAAITTALALLVGYPAAYFIATRPARWRLPLLVLVVLPFWTNLLIRTYAWIVLLNREGLLNRALVGLGLLDRPIALLGTRVAIVLGLLYAYLPLMILPLFSAIERLGPWPRQAAEDLGAGPVRAFLRVTLPLTLPGVMAGCVFVFVPTLGNFIVPDLLGGGKAIMVGNLIQSQFFQARDWPFGAALSISVLAVTTVLLVLQARVLTRERRLVARAS